MRSTQGSGPPRPQPGKEIHGPIKQTTWSIPTEEDERGGGERAGCARGKEVRWVGEEGNRGYASLPLWVTMAGIGKVHGVTGDTGYSSLWCHLRATHEREQGKEVWVCSVDPMCYASHFYGGMWIQPRYYKSNLWSVTNHIPNNSQEILGLILAWFVLQDGRRVSLDRAHVSWGRWAQCWVVHLYVRWSYPGPMASTMVYIHAICYEKSTCMLP
jgi:hypothetical protein